MDILVGTTNSGKLAEIEGTLGDLPLRIISLKSLGEWPKFEEDGSTFEENARKKARIFAEFSGCFTLADDSGLEVDALGGVPGVYSARYSGPGTDDGKNNGKLLHELTDVPKERRGARFVCVIALCAPTSLGGGEWIFRGECEGWIAFSPRGENGFGYDPLFFYPSLGKTLAEINPAAKGRVSHRGRALRKLKEALPSLFSLGSNP
ncbi:MAG: XTP/dITP diphosphatase [Candidatus Binatia bacterium]|nr:XTP/dITP diphosphatase [Candidatus Binatia bacterium]